MKCMVCGRIRTRDVSVCPACGFSFIKVTEREEKSLERLRRFADRYREETLGRVRFFLKIYGYSRTEEGLAFCREELLPLTPYRDLRESEISWNPKRFSRIRRAGSGEIELELVIRSGEREAVQRVRVVPPLETQDWHVGIVRVKEGTVALHVGSLKSSAVSREIDLFACPAVREQAVKGGETA